MATGASATPPHGAALAVFTFECVSEGWVELIGARLTLACFEQNRGFSSFGSSRDCSNKKLPALPPAATNVSKSQVAAIANPISCK